MREKSKKQRAYLKETLAPNRYPMDVDTNLSEKECHSLLDSMPIKWVMNNTRIHNVMSQRSHNQRTKDRGLIFGKQSLAFGYLVGMYYGSSKHLAKSKVKGLSQLSEYQFDILLDAWIVQTLNSGVFCRPQLVNSNYQTRESFNDNIQALVHLGLVEVLTHAQVHTITGLIIPSKSFNKKYYRLRREALAIIDEFNLLFAQSYEKHTKRCWLDDLEAL
jgi:hypothetical protein